MNSIDYSFIIILLIVISIYVYILSKNNLLFNKNKNTKKIISILNHKNSVLFEIFKICVMIIVLFFLYKQKQFLLLLVFTIELLEHINQIIFCYRQNLNSLQIITIVLDFIFIIYAYLKKCYWIIPFFIIGILIHVISIYYNKSFTDIVCITHTKNKNDEKVHSKTKF
jgi:hypothetical protein